LGSVGLVDDESQNGCVAGPVFYDNKLNWSGDHVSVAAVLVPGILLGNSHVEIPAGGLNLLHIAPTALSILGVDVPKEYDMPPLRFRP